MSKKYGFAEEVLEEILEKQDGKCVYCRKEMKKSKIGVSRRDWATVEHLENDGPNERNNIAYCCGSCNSSRRNKELLRWFESSYCREHIPVAINENTVAEVVKREVSEEYRRFGDIENFRNQQVWEFAKTMSDNPHYYIVRDKLSEENRKSFDKFSGYIRRNGYIGWFNSSRYKYCNFDSYKYWVSGGNILNRATLEGKELISK